MEPGELHGAIPSDDMNRISGAHMMHPCTSASFVNVTEALWFMSQNEEPSRHYVMTRLGSVNKVKGVQGESCFLPSKPPQHPVHHTLNTVVKTMCPPKICD